MWSVLVGTQMPVLAVEEEVAAAAEVLVGLGAGRVGGVGQVVGRERRQRVGVDDPGLRRPAIAEGQTLTIRPLRVEGEASRRPRGDAALEVADERAAERARADR